MTADEETGTWMAEEVGTRCGLLNGEPEESCVLVYGT